VVIEGRIRALANVHSLFRKGFGRRIVEKLIAQQKGKTHFDWRATKLVCEITLLTQAG
jgi:two-component sensor histidine kinase